MADTVVQELIVNTLTQAQFDAAKNAGKLSPYELYGTPDTSVRLPVLTPMWFDHIANDVSWLRADTFSWHSGDVYKAAYEHLLADYEDYVQVEDSYIDIILTSPDADLNIYTRKLAVGEKIYYKYGGPVVGTIQSFSESDYSLSYVRPDGSIYTSDGYGVFFTPETDNKWVRDEYGTGNVTYVVAKDGHKITTLDQESNISALYEATGAADYYLLDTRNKQFKLPRKQKRRLIQAVKNTDGTWYNLYSDGWVEQGGYDSAAFSNKTWTYPLEMQDEGYTLTLSVGYDNIGSQNGKFGVTARATTGFSYQVISLAGNAVGKNMSWYVCGYVAESAYASAGMNLEYYYVGSFSQEAIEQTAGINAETFNGKADRDLMNTTDNVDFVIESLLPTAENNYTWYRKYKSGWVEQGGIFTAPSGKSSISMPIVMAGDLNYYKPDVQAIVSSSDARNVQILDTSSATTLGIITNNSFNVCWRVVGQSA